MKIGIKNCVAKEKFSQQGSVLLLCLGVLALLSLLGTALIMMTKQEQESSQNYVEQIRAQLAAESGVETAIAKLRALEIPLHQLPLKLDTLPAPQSTPLQYLTQSSFGILDQDKDGLNECSGWISGTYREMGESYKLRVRSAQNLLNVNDTNTPANIDTDPYEDQLLPERIFTDIPEYMRDDKKGDPDWVYPDDPDYDLNRNGKNLPYPRAQGRLEFILDALVSVLFPHDPDDLSNPDNPPADLGAKAAEALMKARSIANGGRFSTMDELRSALVPHVLSDARFNRLKGYLTLESWQDSNVIKPTFQWRISRPETNPIYFYGDMDPNILYSMLFPADKIPRRRPEFGKIYNPWTWEDEDGTVYPIDEANNPPSKMPEWVRDNEENIYDVYIFSDAQTKYFDLESRSPVDVNSAPMELLQALIRPLTGWWLREEPELDRPDFDPVKDLTAEDWSVPSSPDGHPNVRCHPWYHGGGFVTIYFDYLNMPITTGAYFTDNKYAADVACYYYYDELQSAVGDSGGKPLLWPANVNLGRIESTKKSKRFGRLQEVVMEKHIADEVALSLYTRIHGGGSLAEYKPFSTWEEFEFFLHDLCVQDDPADLVYIKGFKPEMADMLIANFNPNSRLNDYNPNKELFLRVDKSQLMVNTTELCFNTCGLFEIESRGEVRDAEGRLKSAAENYAIVNPGYLLYRMTSQAQFMEGYAPNGGKQSSDFLGPSSSITRTAGLKFKAGILDTDYDGNSLQSYPEPESAMAENRISDCAYDGYLMLSTLEPELSELFAGTDVNQFFARFDGSLNADYSSASLPELCADADGDEWVTRVYRASRYSFYMGAPSCEFYPYDKDCKSPGNYPNADRLCRGLKSKDVIGQKPGILYADGAFSDAGRTLKYDARNAGDTTVSGITGALQFWLKPGFDVSHSNRIREFFSMAPQDIYPNIAQADIALISNQTMFGNDTLEKGSLITTMSTDTSYTLRANNIFKQDFSLYYFSHGGARVPDPKLDTIPIYDVYQDEDWIPTRSLYMNYAHSTKLVNKPEKMAYSHKSSTSANHSWREPDGLGSGNPLFNLETRQWNLLSFSWDFSQALDQALPRTELTINGVLVEARNEETLRPNESVAPNLHLLLDGRPNYIRFGESTTSPFRNNVADSTFDNIVASPKALPISDIIEEYGYGRYSVDATTAYHSPDINLFEGFFYSPAHRLRLFSAAWTLYWPRAPKDSAKASDIRWNGNRSLLSDGYSPVDASRKTQLPGTYPADPMSPFWGEQWAPISLNIYNAQKDEWYYGDSKESSDEMPNFAGGSIDPAWRVKPLVWERGQGFRFRLHFNMRLDQTLFASPILDDVTFVFLSDQPVVKVWDGTIQ